MKTGLKIIVQSCFVIIMIIITIIIIIIIIIIIASATLPNDLTFAYLIHFKFPDSSKKIAIFQ